MITIEKPPLSGVYLAHFGTKGMKWGVRKSKKITGISRPRSALLDRNAFYLRNRKNAIVGKGSHGAAGALGRKMLGSERWHRQMQNSIKSIHDQNARLRSGKLTVTDRLQLVFQTTPINLIVSTTPR